MPLIKSTLLHLVALALVALVSWGVIWLFKLNGAMTDGIVVLVVAALEKVLREVGKDWVNN